MSFNVTKKHIEEWYKENQWWADDLNVEEKIHLCKLFYIYQVVHQQRNPEIEIQSENARFKLSKKLAKLLNIKKYKELTSVDMTTPPVPSTEKILQPFYSKYQDIVSLVKDETVTILTIDPTALNTIRNAQYQEHIDEIFEKIHSKFERKYYNDDDYLLYPSFFTGQQKKHLSILYGYCLVKIAERYESITTPCNIPFMTTYLMTNYRGFRCNMTDINSLIFFPSKQKIDRNELIEQMVYHNMFRYYIGKGQNEIPCLLKIYYEIVHNAECLYYGNISSANHSFFVANRNNRKITNPYPSYRISSFENYWSKIRDKKFFYTNIEDFNKSLTIRGTFEDFLKEYYFTYTTTDKEIVIKIETRPSSSEEVIMKKEKFIEQLTPFRDRSLFDNQLSYFYEYLKSDIDYKTKFTYNDQKGTIFEGVFLDKNESTSQIEGQQITFDIFEKYLKGEKNIATIMKQMVKKIKNWSKMNDRHNGMDGRDFNRSYDGMMNDGMKRTAEQIMEHDNKIKQSIMNVLYKFQRNLVDNRNIQSINNRDYFINYCDAAIKKFTPEERTRKWDNAEITSEQLNTINMEFITFKENRLDYLSKQTIDRHNINNTDIYEEDAVKDILLATGLILPSGLNQPSTLEKVNGIVINTLPRNISKKVEKNIITVEVSCSSLLKLLNSTYNYRQIFNSTDIGLVVPNTETNTDIMINDVANKLYELWTDDDLKLFEKIILYKATLIRQEKNKKTWLSTLFSYVPSGEKFLIFVLLAVLAYVILNAQQVKKQEIMRLENYTNVTALNTMSLVDLNYLQKDISRHKYGSELIKTFVKKAVECHKLIAIYDYNLLEVSYAYWLIKNYALNKLSFSPEDIDVARKILGENLLFNPDGSLKEFEPILTLKDINRCFQGVETSYSKLTDKFPDDKVKLGNFNFTIEHFKILGIGTFQDLNSKKTRLGIKSRNIFDILQSGSDIETTKKITGECNVGTFTDTISSDITEECKSGTFTELTKNMATEYNDRLTKNSKAIITLTSTTNMMPYKDYFENFLKLSGKKEEETFWYTPIMNLINYYLHPKKTYHKFRFDSINFKNWQKMYNDGFTDDTDQLITYQMFFELFKYINNTQFNDEKILQAIKESIHSRNSTIIEKAGVVLTDFYEKGGVVLKETHEKGLTEAIIKYVYPEKPDEDEAYLTPVAEEAIKTWDEKEEHSTSTFTSTSTSTSTVEEVPDGGRGRRHKSSRHKSSRHKSKKSIKKYHGRSKKSHKKSFHKKKSRTSFQKKDVKNSKKHNSQKEKKTNKKKSRK